MRDLKNAQKQIGQHSPFFLGYCLSHESPMNWTASSWGISSPLVLWGMCVGGGGVRRTRPWPILGRTLLPLGGVPRAPFGRTPTRGPRVLTQGYRTSELPYSAGGVILRPPPYPPRCEEGSPSDLSPLEGAVGGGGGIVNSTSCTWRA